MREREYSCPHFTDEETEIQRGHTASVEQLRHEIWFRMIVLFKDLSRNYDISKHFRKRRRGGMREVGNSRNVAFDLGDLGVLSLLLIYRNGSDCIINMFQ